MTHFDPEPTVAERDQPSIDRLKADVPALGAPANFLVIGSLAKELREKI